MTDERDEANKRGDAWRFRADIAEVKLAECEARLGKAVDVLRFYTCTDDGCDGCPEQDRDRVGCGWTARTTLAEIENSEAVTLGEKG